MPSSLSKSSVAFRSGEPDVLHFFKHLLEDAENTKSFSIIWVMENGLIYKAFWLAPAAVIRWL